MRGPIPILMCPWTGTLKMRNPTDSAYLQDRNSMDRCMSGTTKAKHIVFDEYISAVYRYFSTAQNRNWRGHVTDQPRGYLSGIWRWGYGYCSSRESSGDDSDRRRGRVCSKRERQNHLLRRASLHWISRANRMNEKSLISWNQRISPRMLFYLTLRNSSEIRCIGSVSYGRQLDSSITRPSLKRYHCVQLILALLFTYALHFR